MPLETSVFPEEVQVAFFMFDLLSDVLDTFSGTYLGKDWSQCSQLFDLYRVENRREVLYFMKMYERKLMKFEAEKRAKEQKREQQKNQSGGKNFTHNVRG